MAIEENGFLEYLQLQGSEPDLVTKSELLAEVRQRGYSIGDRQLSFYVSEGILPKSVRVGSRAGAYPRIVGDLLKWVLRARDGGLTVDAIRELLPIWKLLTRARREKRLDLLELQYMARQHVRSTEGSMAMPVVVSDVLTICPDCQGCVPADIVVVMKDGTEKNLEDINTTLGFAIARQVTIENEDESIEVRSEWIARTRITLATGVDKDLRTDPTTVILGVGPNDSLPESSGAPGVSNGAHPDVTKTAAVVAGDTQ
jgi:DNA-binding transcriptional MerR regulator